MSTVDLTMSPEDYARLCKLRTDARWAEDDYLQQAERAKQAKKTMESSQLRVNKFLDEMADGPLPLEEQAQRNRECVVNPGDPSALFADDKPADEPGTVPVSEEPGEFAVIAEDERWRSVPIEGVGNHGIKPSLVKRLKDAGIHTVGDLADYSTADRDLTSISGIGQTSKDEIVDAMISYFEANPMPKREVVAPTAQGDQGESSEASQEGPQPSPGEPLEEIPVDSPSERGGTVEGQAEALEEEQPKQPKQPRRSRKQSPGLPLNENETTT